MKKVRQNGIRLIPISSIRNMNKREVEIVKGGVCPHERGSFRAQKEAIENSFDPYI
ncbi:hypothetical protein ABU952_14460 [Bacillus amyloliquefaciens]|uniref:hypothetical protein n=1 Tax=Bacillus amyloliquefaciens TaxID=1390 RepID=UPI00336B2BFC